MILWLLRFLLDLALDELRAQLRPFLAPFAVVEDEMRWQAEGWA